MTDQPNALKNDSGGIIGSRSTAQDTAIEETEKSFRRIFDACPMGVHQYALLECNQLVFIGANPSANTILGVDHSIFLGKTIEEAFPGLVETEVPARYRDAAKNGVEWRTEQIAYDEGTIKGAFDVVAFQTEPGKMAVFFSDITERKRALQAISAEKERLAVTLRSIGDGVITTDMQGTIATMNNVAESLTGWLQEEAVHKPLSTVFNIVNEITGLPHENPVEKVLASGKIVELANHTVLISKNGTRRSIADSGAPIKDAHDTIIGVVLVFRDITEKQRLIESAQKNQKLESLGILAGGIAHDFNNLLGGIFGYIDLARTVCKDRETTTYLDTVMTTMNRARSLTQQLLTFSKGGTPSKKTESLVPFIQDTTLFALSGSHVSCTFEIPDNLLFCQIDKNQIGQVIENIVINAQQAMPMGGTIKVSACNQVIHKNQHPELPEGTYIKISVSDHGIGIAKEIIPHIFDPFFTTKTKGHGLGLSTCHSIVTRHGGAIEVESHVEKGSTFHIYLQAALEPLDEEPYEMVADHRGSGTFIVMDDEKVMREAIGNMLSILGYEVLLTYDGLEAVTCFHGETQNGRPVAGILLDLTVPGGMGGLEAAREIRKMNTDIPLFVASGYAVDPVMAHPAEYGFTASICKPFRVNELKEMLNAFL